MTDALSGQGKTILHLTGPNYREWAKRMRMAMEVRGLLEVIERDDEPEEEEEEEYESAVEETTAKTGEEGQHAPAVTPRKPTAAERAREARALKVWQKTDLEARALLVANLDASILLAVDIATPAHEIWANLKETYGMVDPVTRHQLKAELDKFRAKMLAWS